MSLVAEVNAQEIARLLTAIDAQAPAGLFDVEDETYQAIDQEMVKLGGLQEATIDWVYIEEASRQYLEQQCKHLRIVAHLSAAWLRSACWERWALTLTLLAGMVERYWETAYPKPGPKGYLGKRKLVGLVLNRLNEALPRLDRFTYSPAHAAGRNRRCCGCNSCKPWPCWTTPCSMIWRGCYASTRNGRVAQASLLRPGLRRPSSSPRHWPKSSPHPCPACR